MSRLAPLLAVVVACGPVDSGPGGTLRVTLEVPRDASLESLQVTTIRISVQGYDLDQDVIATFPLSGGGGTLDGIPYGGRRTVTVEAMTEEGTIVARGRSVSVALDPPEDGEVVVLVAPVGRFTAAYEYGRPDVPSVLSGGRVGHTATPLPDGRVLIAGGATVRLVDAEGGASVQAIDQLAETLEVYDPRTGRVEVLGERLEPGRAFHTATRLRGSRGWVLIAGGMTYTNGRLVTTPIADIFDPTEGQLFPVHDLVSSRARHSAALRPDGSVLLTGGVVINGGQPEDFARTDGPVGVAGSAELFVISPTAPEALGCTHSEWTFCVQGQLADARADHASVRIGDAVLVIGGRGREGPVSSTEQFTQADAGAPGSLASIPGLALHEARWGAAVVRRADESVVVAGGEGVDELGEPGPLNSLEVMTFDGQRRPTAFARQTAVTGMGRRDPVAVALEDDAILVAGGFGPGGNPLADARVFGWLEGGVDDRPRVGDLLTGRAGALGVLMDTGAVLVVGGQSGTAEAPEFPTTLEIYTP